MLNKILTELIFHMRRTTLHCNLIKQKLGLKKSFVAANFLQKLFSCAFKFMLIDYENKRLVEGERNRENIFWKQPQIVFFIFYHICVNLADTKILRPPSACSKLEEFLAISLDCVSWFSSLFSTFPDRLRCVLLCLWVFIHKYS